MLMVAVATGGTDLVGRLDVDPDGDPPGVPLISLALTTLLCGAVFARLPARPCDGAPRGPAQR